LLKKTRNLYEQFLKFSLDIHQKTICPDEKASVIFMPCRISLVSSEKLSNEYSHAMICVFIDSVSLSGIWTIDPFVTPGMSVLSL